MTECPYVNFQIVATKAAQLYIEGEADAPTPLDKINWIKNFVCKAYEKSGPLHKNGQQLRDEDGKTLDSYRSAEHPKFWANVIIPELTIEVHLPPEDETLNPENGGFDFYALLLFRKT